MWLGGGLRSSMNIFRPGGGCWGGEGAESARLVVEFIRAGQLYTGHKVTVTFLQAYTMVFRSLHGVLLGEQRNLKRLVEIEKDRCRNPPDSWTVVCLAARAPWQRRMWPTQFCPIVKMLFLRLRAPGFAAPTAVAEKERFWPGRGTGLRPACWKHRVALKMTTSIIGTR